MYNTLYECVNAALQDMCRTVLEFAERNLAGPTVDLQGETIPADSHRKTLKKNAQETMTVTVYRATMMTDCVIAIHQILKMLRRNKSSSL